MNPANKAVNKDEFSSLVISLAIKQLIKVKELISKAGNILKQKGMNENNLFDKARQEFIEKIKEVYHEEKLLR